ncbi:MAG: hypothetical protein H6733_01610 [Alphaproteobacteria bacterium]|nr:hypothetical protein [Alphaproteobacteria bacterium]
MRAVAWLVFTLACATPTPDAAPMSSDATAWPAPPPGPLAAAFDLTLGSVALAPGQATPVTVSGGPPGAPVWLVGSPSTGASACPALLAPHCLDVGSPTAFLGHATFDPSGHASLTVQVPARAPATRIELQAVAYAPGTVHLSAPVWTPIQAATPRCVALDPATSTPLTTALLLRLGYVDLWDTSDALDTDPWWQGSHVIEDDAAYQALQAALGRTLPAVDFTVDRVVWAWDGSTSTCGLAHGDAQAWQRADGAVQLQLDVEDQSRFCCASCDALGSALTVWRVATRTAPIVCRDALGGCTPPDSGSGDTDVYCGP